MLLGSPVRLVGPVSPGVSAQQAVPEKLEPETRVAEWAKALRPDLPRQYDRKEPADRHSRSSSVISQPFITP